MFTWLLKFPFKGLRSVCVGKFINSPLTQIAHPKLEPLTSREQLSDEHRIKVVLMEKTLD